MNGQGRDGDLVRFFFWKKIGIVSKKGKITGKKEENVIL